MTLKKKKSPRQGSWPQKSGLGMHQNPIFNANQSKNPKIDSSSFWRSAAEAAACKCAAAGLSPASKGVPDQS